jgi:hypothetical protein
MTNGETNAADRRKRRASWPIRTFTLGQEPPDDLRATTTPEERLAMVDTLTQELWTLTGLAVATYARAETPISRRPWPPSLTAGETR